MFNDRRWPAFIRGECRVAKEPGNRRSPSGAPTAQLSPGGRIGEISRDLPTAVYLTMEYIDRGLFNSLFRTPGLLDFERPYQSDDRRLAIDHDLVDFYRIAVGDVRISYSRTQHFAQ